MKMAALGVSVLTRVRNRKKIGHFGGLQRFRPASWPISIARRGSIGYWLRDERNQAAHIATISLAFPRYTVVCLLYAP
jgi:hypothetical protein